MGSVHTGGLLSLPFIIVIAPLYTVGRSSIITSFLLVLPRNPPVRKSKTNDSVSDPESDSSRLFGEFVYPGP